MMTQDERRVWLLEYLLNENENYKDMAVPTDPRDQKDLLRALMNVRLPYQISEEFLKEQDIYIKEENRKAGITDINDLAPVKNDPLLYLWQGDITSLRVDAIVNAANSGLCGCYRPLHSCVDNIIHSKSGIQLRLKCNDIITAQGHEEPTGQAKITPAYNLPCRFVLHTVGPIVKGKLTKEHEDLLVSCYNECLKLAELNKCTSIAFCCISTGVFMFPNRRAAELAVETVRKYRAETGSAMKVVFNVFKDEDLKIYSEILK